ncbi:MAG: hypothetical protein HY595_05500 [Candidatus Omnitrophica bacterium]|nr:hypothetical protein [Candidatus Omnitrophota bacterium]
MTFRPQFRLQDVHVIVGMALALGCGSTRAVAQPQEQPTDQLAVQAPRDSAASLSVPGELIVKFTPEAAQSIEQARLTNTLPTTGLSSLDALFQRYGVTAVDRVFPDAPNQVAEELEAAGLRRVYVLQVSSEMDLLAMAAAFSQDPSVEYAEPNYLATIHADSGRIE